MYGTNFIAVIKKNTEMIIWNGNYDDFFGIKVVFFQ